MMHWCKSKLSGDKTGKKDSKSNVIIHVLSDEPITANEELAISKAFNPINISMMSFGLVWKSHKISSTRKCADIHTFHCIFMFLLVWCHAFQYVALFDGKEKLDEMLILKLIGQIYSIQMALCFTAFVYFNHKHVPFFLRQWENYKLKHGGLPLTVMNKSVLRRIIGGNILFVLLFICVGLTHIFGSSHDYKYKSNLIPILKLTRGRFRQIAQFLYGPLLFYILIAMLQTVLIVTGFCSLISKEFRQLSQEFADTVSKNSKIVYSGMQRWNSQGTLHAPKRMHHNSYEVEQFRLRHLDLALLVARLDNIMHAYLLFLYLFTLPIIVLMLFGMGDAPGIMFEDFATYISGLSGLIYMSTVIIWISNAGTSLANSVCKIFFVVELESSVLLN